MFKGIKTINVTLFLFLTVLIMYLFHAERNSNMTEIYKTHLESFKHSIEVSKQKEPRADKELPFIYMITPTYPRSTRVPNFIRLTHTLTMVKNLHWIVVEDRHNKSSSIEELLRHSGLLYSYLCLPSSYHPSLKTRINNKGIEPRNIGIDHAKFIHKTYKPSSSAVVFFGDDDNTYTLDLFNEMRFTKKVSIWPVGLVGGEEVEYPIVKNGKVVSFHGWNLKRKFATDMASFALNIGVFFKVHDMYFNYTTPGFLETHFLEKCCTLADLEPKGANCTKILVWHTKTQSPIVAKEHAFVF